MVATIFPNCFWFEWLHQTVLLPSAVLYTLYKDNSLEKPGCQILSFQCRQTIVNLTCQTIRWQSDKTRERKWSVSAKYWLLGTGRRNQVSRFSILKCLLRSPTRGSNTVLVLEGKQVSTNLPSIQKIPRAQSESLERVHLFTIVTSCQVSLRSRKKQEKGSFQSFHFAIVCTGQSK